MAISQQQKVDFLLKKIGYTKTKTGLAVDSSLSGTKKAGFAEALPSPLIIADTSLWTESGLIPTTPPGSDSSQVKVYLAGSSGLRMTVDSTVAGNRAFLAYTTYNNTSSARLTNWIDTQFGNDYLIKVYKGDPNSGGVALSASGSGANDGWFFDYSAGVLNFNDTNVPSGVTGTNIYIVGYRYIGNTGAPTPGDDFSFQDLTVTRNLSVTGLSTFTGLVDINGGITATTGTFEDLGGANRIVFSATSGSGGKLKDSGNLSYVTGTNTLNVVNLLASTSIDLNGDLDVDGHTNLDNVSIAGVTTATGNIVANGSIDLAGDIDVDGHTNLDNVSIAGVTTAAGAIDLNADLDVDGHTNLDNVSVSGVTTFTGAITANGAIDLNADLDVDGHTNLDNVSIAGVTTAAGNIVANGNIVGDNATNISGINLVTAATLDISGDVDIDGHTNLDNVSVSGVSTFTGSITANGAIDLNADLDVDGHTNLDNVSVAGVSTFAGTVNTASIVATGIDLNGDIDVDGHTNLDNVSVAGVSTFASAIDLNADLDVDGHTNLDNVSISGVTTTAGDVDIQLQNTFAYYDDSSNTFEMGLKSGQSGRGVHVGFGSEGQSSSFSLFYSGYDSYVRNTGTYQPNSELRLISYDGGVRIAKGGNAGAQVSIANTSWTNLTSTSALFNTGVDLFFNNSRKLQTTNTGINITGSVVATGADINGDIDVDGHTNLDNVSIAGVSTFTGGITANGAIDLNADLDVDGHTNLDNVSIAGVVTATGNIVANGSIDLAGDIDVEGHTNLDNLSVAGVTTTAGLLDINAGANASTLRVEDLTSGRVVLAGAGGEIQDNANLTFNGSNLTVGGNVIAADGNFSGNVTIGGTLTYEDVQNVDAVGLVTAREGIDVNARGINIDAGGLNVVAGISTFNANIDANANIDIARDLNVDGHTNLDNVSIAGVTTFSNNTVFSSSLDVNADLDVDGHTNLDNVSIAGVTTATGNIVANGSIDLAGDIDVDGHTNLDNVSIAGVTTAAGAIDLNADLDVDGHTNLDNVSISGVTTATGAIDLNADLDVDGHTNLDNVSVAGISTFSSNVIFPDGVSAKFGTDLDGEVKHTGSNLQIQETTGNIQITNYANDKDIIINTDDGSGGTALYFKADGSTGETILYNYGNEKIKTTSTGVSITGNNVVSGNVTAVDGTFSGDLDVDGHTNLDNVSIAGVSTFASAIDANGNLDVDGQTDLDILNVAETATFSALVDINADIDVDGHTNLDNVSIAGVTTAAGAIDLNADLDVDGHTNLDNVSISGVATATSLTIDDYIYHSGDTNTFIGFDANDTIVFDTNGSTKLKINSSGHLILSDDDDTYFNRPSNDTLAFTTGGSQRLSISSSGINVTGSVVATGADINGDIDVDGHTNLDNVSVAGVSTFSNNVFIGSANLTIDGDTQHSGNVNVTGVSTFGGAIDANGDLDVDGHTNLDNVSIAGVTTAAGNIVANGSIDLAGDIDVDGHTNLDNVSIAGVTTATGKIDANADVDVAGTLDVDGHTNLDNVSIAGVVTATTFVGNGDFVELDVDGHTNLDNVSIAGVTTFTGAIDANGDLDVDGHTELDNVNVAGLATVSQLKIGSITANAILDEDNMASNSATALPTQQSVKAYVDTQIGTADDNLNIAGDSGTGTVDLDAQSLTVSGTANEIVTSASGQAITVALPDNVTIGNQLTVTGAIDANGDLDVDGHTNLDNVSISGVTTFSGALDINAGVNISGVGDFAASTFNNIRLAYSGDNEIDTSSGNLILDSAGGTVEVTDNLTVSGAIAAAGAIDLNADLDVDGHTNLDNVSVSGVSTFTGAITANGSIDLNADLDVDGHTNLDNVSVAGVTTFATTAEFDGTAKFDSTITAGGATGSNGQYLKATGSGVAWASFPTLRTTSVQTATAGQTTFSFSYNASFLDVFVNGTKLTPAEYTASNGTSIVLDIGCFVGDIVEFYSYQTTPGAGGGIPDVVSDTSPELGGTLDLNGNTISGTGHINVTGNLKVSGMTTTAAISLGGHIIPTVNNTYDIGNASFKIRDIYEQNGSDERIKEDIVPFTGGLDFVNQIPVVSFTFKDIDYNEYTRGKRETGFIAQDIKRALDNSTYESYRLWTENPDSYQGLDKKQLIPALVSAIQELTARVEELENK